MITEFAAEVVAALCTQERAKLTDVLAGVKVPAALRVRRRAVLTLREHGYTLEATASALGYRCHTSVIDAIAAAARHGDAPLDEETLGWMPDRPQTAASRARQAMARARYDGPPRVGGDQAAAFWARTATRTEA